MKSLKSAARKGVIISAAAMTALALSSCSAGHITQTATKVEAVDGASGQTEDGNIAVRDVTIFVDPNTGDASLKFVAANQGYEEKKFQLRSVEVEGTPVELTPAAQPINRDERIIGDSAEGLKAIKRTTDKTVQYVETTLPNQDLGFGGNRDVTFTFDNGTVTVAAAVAAPPMPAGEFNRDSKSEVGYTTETAGAEAGHAHH